MITMNGVKITPTIFPDGTSQVWKIDNLPSNTLVTVIWWFEYEAELLHLLQLCHLLRSNGCNPHVRIPYLPYARQDKEVNNESCFAGTTLIDGLLTFMVGVTTTLDRHSQPHHSRVFSYDPVFPQGYDSIIFPDHGAYTRYRHLVTCEELFIADKERDQSTGYITKFALQGKPSGRCLVVDDLCDGGKTFEILADSVDHPLDLYVTHGVFSKGVDHLLSRYKHIYTTDSYIKNSWYDLDVAAQQSTTHKQLRNAVREKLLTVFSSIEMMQNAKCVPITVN